MKDDYTVSKAIKMEGICDDCGFSGKVMIITIETRESTMAVVEICSDCLEKYLKQLKN
jgi:formate dehydrogenase maturation protein FdhE